jgi:hypothetical protein
MSPRTLEYLCSLTTSTADLGLDHLVSEGIIVPAGPSSHELTDRGRAWLDMILDTPMPVQLWADPRKLPSTELVAEVSRRTMQRAFDSAVGVTAAKQDPSPPVPPGYTPHDGTGRPPIWNENGKVGMPDVVLVYRGMPKPKQQRPNRLPLGSVNWKWGAAPSNDDVIGYRIAEVE